MTLYIHPRTAGPTKFSSSHNRLAPEAFTSARADRQPTGAPATTQPRAPHAHRLRPISSARLMPILVHEPPRRWNTAACIPPGSRSSTLRCTIAAKEHFVEARDCHRPCCRRHGCLVRCAAAARPRAAHGLRCTRAACARCNSRAQPAIGWYRRRGDNCRCRGARWARLRHHHGPRRRHARAGPAAVP